MNKIKKLKIFYMGEKLRDVYPHATRWQVIKYRTRMMFKRLIRLSAVGAGGYIVFMAGAWLNPTIIEATVEKIVPVVIDAPVLERIAKCESGGNHFGKSGQVLAVGNDNKSVDVGKYQINVSVWGKTATEMGLDLFNEEDNKEFAQYLYSHFGTEPWYLSKECWNK